MLIYRPPLHPETVSDPEISKISVYLVGLYLARCAQARTPLMFHLIVVVTGFSEPWNVQKAEMRYEFSIGDKSKWLHRYDTYAQAKVGELLHSLNPNSKTKAVRPPYDTLHLFGQRDENIVVACSGNYRIIENLPAAIIINCQDHAAARWEKTERWVSARRRHS